MKKQYKNRTVNHDFVAMPRKKADAKKAPIPAHPPDRFEAREVRGSDIAEAILAWQNPKTGTMPVPPRRRSA